MRIPRENCTGVVIDIQEKLFPHMFRKEKLLRNTLLLLNGLKLLGIPVIRTEQYPKGLGTTLEPIRLGSAAEDSIEKIAFSCCDQPEFISALEQKETKTVLICGIETHVCVLQTAIDLLAGEFIPVVVTDCVSSRRKKDKKIALERMRTEGVILTTVESLLFELTGTAGTEEFKAISRLVK